MRRASNSALLFAAVSLAVLYVGLALSYPAGAFFSGDEGIKWLQVDSIWRHHWSTLAVEPPGAAFDPQGDFLPAFLVQARGRVWSIFSSLVPLLASVPYALGGTRAIYLIPALSAVLAVPAAAKLATFLVPGAGERAAWRASLAGIAAVACTPVLFYGATFWEHAPAVALVLAGLIALCRPDGATDRDADLRRGLAGGLLLGLAGAARAEAALMLPAAAAGGLIAWGAWGRQGFATRAVAMVVGAATVLLPRAVYHNVVFGSYLPPHLKANLPGGALGQPGVELWSTCRDLLAPVVLRPVYYAMAALLLVAFAAGPVRRWCATRLPAGALLGSCLCLSALLLVAPMLTVALQLGGAPLSTRERGFHSLAHTVPALALLPLLVTPAEAGSRRRPSHPRSLMFVSWTAGLFVLMAVALAPVPGGLQWGPRLLLPAIPLLTIALLAGAWRRGREVRIAAWIVLAVGLAVQATGLRFLGAVRSYNAQVIQQVRQNVPDDGVILSDFFAVPQILATLRSSTPVLYVRPGADLDRLSARIDELAATPFWIVQAPARSSAARPDGARPAAAEEVELAPGLRLVRFRDEAGVRGFSRIPSGD